MVQPCPFLMSVDDVMAFFRLSESRTRFPRKTIERYRKMGLRSVRVGRRVWYRLDDVLRFLDEQQERLQDGSSLGDTAMNWKEQTPDDLVQLVVAVSFFVVAPLAYLSGAHILFVYFIAFGPLVLYLWQGWRLSGSASERLSARLNKCADEQAEQCDDSDDMSQEEANHG